VRLRLTPLIAALAFALAPTASAAGITPRIVGGGPATSPHAFMAALVVPGFANDADGTFCGATVIAPYAYLTAAHCIIQDQPTPHTLGPADLIVATGRTDLSLPGGQRLAVRKIVTHPDFGTPFALANDVAIVFTIAPTTSAAVARDTVSPAEGETGTALGWGATDLSPDPPATYPAQLREAALPILASDACTTPGVVCAGVTSPNICIGDSGGPLLVTRAGVTRQVGIASAILTGSASTPVCGIDSSEFVDVSVYNSWIDAQLAPAVAGVAVSAAGGALHVTWQRVPGGAEPAVAVATTDGTIHSAAPGAASLDITGLPLGVALGATVSVTNTWGTASATSAGTATLVGAAPAITGLAVSAAKKITGNVATGGFVSTVKAQYGVDTAHLTTTAATSLPAVPGAATVTIPFGTLAAGRTYRARMIAQNSAGTTVSAWVTFTTPATRPVATRKPKISGTSRVGRTLTCAPGTWTAAPAPRYSYAWRIGGKLSKTQKKSKLKLTNAMLGKSVSCAVTAKNPAAAVTVRSAAVTVRRR
jgi:hypothetical protein